MAGSKYAENSSARCEVRNIIKWQGPRRNYDGNINNDICKRCDIHCFLKPLFCVKGNRHIGKYAEIMPIKNRGTLISAREK